jgi:hypothetical protein
VSKHVVLDSKHTCCKNVMLRKNTVIIIIIITIIIIINIIIITITIIIIIIIIMYLNRRCVLSGDSGTTLRHNIK